MLLCLLLSLPLLLRFTRFAITLFADTGDGYSAAAAIRCDALFFMMPPLRCYCFCLLRAICCLSAMLRAIADADATLIFFAGALCQARDAAIMLCRRRLLDLLMLSYYNMFTRFICAMPLAPP